MTRTLTVPTMLALILVSVEVVMLAMENLVQVCILCKYKFYILFQIYLGLKNIVQLRKRKSDKFIWRCNITTIKLHFFILIDINECSLGTYSCHSNADCINTVGSYSCQCRSGYAGTGKSCAGICILCKYKFYILFQIYLGLKNIVQLRKRKSDKFIWRCNITTIKLIFFILIDINECSLGTYSCHSNADCINTVGSYSCQCRSGYVGNGKSCAGMYFM